MWMNQWFYSQYKDKVSSYMRTAFVSSFLVGLTAHLYMLTNKLPNYDDIVCLTGGGVSLSGGRWMFGLMRQFVSKVMGDYSLPWLYGLLSIILISLSVALIIDFLQIRNRFYSFLVAAVVISYPAFVSTLFFMFLSIYYSIGIFMGTVSVWCTYKFRNGWLYAVPLLACTTGVYQAYMPYVCALFVLIILKNILCAEENIVKKIFLAARVVVLGSALYMIFLKLSLVLTGRELISYQGLDKIGSINIKTLPLRIRDAYSNFFGLMYKDVYGLNPYMLNKGMVFISILIVCIVLISWLRKQYIEKRYDLCTWMICFIVIFPLAANGILILVPSEASVYTLMMWGSVCTLILPILVVFWGWIESNRGNIYKFFIEWLFSFVFIIIIVCQCQNANVQYLALDLQYKQAHSYYTVLVTQIKSLDGFSQAMPVVFIGDRFNDETYYTNDHVLGGGGGRQGSLIGVNTIEFLKVYLGFDPFIPEDNSKWIDNQNVKMMPCYPDAGSVKIVDNAIVIKLQDIE